MDVTIGNLIDQLSITNIRLWMLEDICRKPKASDKEIAEAKTKINTCNQLRTDLIQAIDEGLNKIAEGEKQKLYSQGSLKIYGSKDEKK